MPQVGQAEPKRTSNLLSHLTHLCEQTACFPDRWQKAATPIHMPLMVSPISALFLLHGAEEMIVVAAELSESVQRYVQEWLECPQDRRPKRLVEPERLEVISMTWLETSKAGPPRVRGKNGIKVFSPQGKLHDTDLPKSRPKSSRLHLQLLITASPPPTLRYCHRG